MKRNFISDINSFVIKIAAEVNKAEQLVFGFPILGLINEKVLDIFADPDPIKISVIISIIFCLFKLFYSFF